MRNPCHSCKNSCMKKNFIVGMLILTFMFLMTSCSNNHAPICLHPDNPHYFLFRGKPVVLIGSTEHYGGVLNLDFDYIPYFDELHGKGLNVTRTFSGIYLEPRGAFGIAENTLAPARERLICPWARSDQPGYANGGNRFDLTRWDDAYFNRLKDFVSEAGKRNIVVELDLFSNFYDTLQWKLSPLCAGNNVNGIGNIDDHKEILSLQHPDILAVQEKMVRKIVETLKGFDNLYYEVCNEPYFGDLEALETWEQHMTSVVAEAERRFRRKHLISQNIANHSLKIENPNPLVSVCNFHYSRPPVTVEMNYGLNRVTGDNETGFDGIEDVHYRTEAWNFMVAGGGLFNNLDYSFTVDHENGSFRVPADQPGGGGHALRSQLRILKQVFDEISFISMKPVNEILKGPFDVLPKVRVLGGNGQYLLYLDATKPEDSDQPDSLAGLQTATMILELPVGRYAGSWIEPKSGDRTVQDFAVHPPGRVVLDVPPFAEDLAFLVRKK